MVKMIKLLPVALIAFLVTGCLSGAQYEEYWEPVSKDSGVVLVDALRICNQQAAAAASQASANASANATTGGGFAGGLASGLNQGLAGPLARKGAMNSCMVSYGFRKQRMCVASC